MLRKNIVSTKMIHEVMNVKSSIYLIMIVTVSFVYAEKSDTLSTRGTTEQKLTVHSPSSERVINEESLVSLGFYRTRIIHLR